MTCRIDTLPERFWSKVDRRSDNDCWPWNGCTLPTGYGQIVTEGNSKDYAHRVSYRLAVGEIPPGLVLDHLCRNRSCCNPQHLEAVSNRTNVLRGVGPSAINARASKCTNGHDLTADNLLVESDGHRVCRECKRLKDQRYRQRLAARRPPSPPSEVTDAPPDRLDLRQRLSPAAGPHGRMGTVEPRPGPLLAVQRTARHVRPQPQRPPPQRHPSEVDRRPHQRR